VVVPTKRGRLIKAVAYIRMSTDEQSLSPEQQREALIRFAAERGYEIVKWYEDAGMSASKGDEERIAYQQLLIDSNALQWQAVLCWDTSRFTRNHPAEAMVGHNILRKNGVWLDTVQDGKIDWGTFEGFFKSVLKGWSDHEFALKVGGGSMRGRMLTFHCGGYAYGAIPYGYNREYRRGPERRIVPRGQHSKNEKGWMQFLAVVEEEAAVVERIFRWFVTDDKSLAEIARLLNSECVPGPGRGKDSEWNVENVKSRLTCPAYARISRVGAPPKRKRKRLGHFAAEERLGDWPAIVERDLFDAAQAKLARNCHPRAGQVDGQRRDAQAQEKRSGLLQGIARCAHCGQALHKDPSGRKDDPRGDKYRCANPSRGTKTGCGSWTCRESDLMPVVTAELVKAIDDATLAQLQARPDEPTRISNEEVLRAHLASLEERVGKAADAFLDPGVSQTMKKALEARVEQLEADIEDTKQRLAAVELAQDMGGIERFRAWWEQVRPQLLLLAADGTVSAVEWSAVESVPAPWESLGQLAEPVSGKPTAPADAHLLFAAGGGMVAGAVLDGAGPGTIDTIIADRGKLRGLLKRLGVKVFVRWRPATEADLAAGTGRGRRRKWVLDSVRLIGGTCQALQVSTWPSAGFGR
jgi:DNA invertase Pin-like site-specific DNA recombinase